MDLIFEIRDSGIAVVVIEHDMRFIFNLCDRVLCLVQGETLVEGTPAEVQSDPRVIEAYIGTGDDDDEEPRSSRARRAGQRPRRASRRRQRTTTARLRGATEGEEAASDRHARGPRPARRLRQDRGRQGHHLLASSRARSSRSSAPTAPARPPRCAPSPGCSGPVGGEHQLPGQADPQHRRPRHRRARHRPLPRGPADLPAADASRRTCSSAPSPARTTARDPHRHATRPTTSSRSSGSAASSRPARSPAASSRCSPWAAP